MLANRPHNPTENHKQNCPEISKLTFPHTFLGSLRLDKVLYCLQSLPHCTVQRVLFPECLQHFNLLSMGKKLSVDSSQMCNYLFLAGCDMANCLSQHRLVLQSRIQPIADSI